MPAQRTNASTPRLTRFLSRAQWDKASHLLKVSRTLADGSVAFSTYEPEVAEAVMRAHEKIVAKPQDFTAAKGGEYYLPGAYLTIAEAVNADPRCRLKFCVPDAQGDLIVPPLPFERKHFDFSNVFSAHAPAGGKQGKQPHRPQQRDTKVARLERELNKKNADIADILIAQEKQRHKKSSVADYHRHDRKAKKDKHAQRKDKKAKRAPNFAWVPPERPQAIPMVLDPLPPALMPVEVAPVQKDLPPLNAPAAHATPAEQQGRPRTPVYDRDWDMERNYARSPGGPYMPSPVFSPPSPGRAPSPLRLSDMDAEGSDDDDLISLGDEEEAAAAREQGSQEAVTVISPHGEAVEIAPDVLTTDDVFGVFATAAVTRPPVYGPRQPTSEVIKNLSFRVVKDKAASKEQEGQGEVEKDVVMEDQTSIAEDAPADGHAEPIAGPSSASS